MRSNELLGFLKVDPKRPARLVSRESSKLEYKESFNWGSRAKYAKTMAAFANNAGGAIVFGVKNAPQDMVGVNSQRFQNLDPAKVTEYLNTKFAPELIWESAIVELADFELGVIAVMPATEKPVVCINDDGNDLREADIYYRYRGRSERIRYPELHRLMEKRQKKEREALLQHLRKIARIGSDSVGILDLKKGELSGIRDNVVIDPSILSQVQFIREGQFAESNESGAPTLRLVGDAQVVEPGALLPIKKVATPIAIGPKELMLGFLRQEQPPEPREYLKQACRESSHNMPIYHFVRLAEMRLEEMRELVLEETPNCKRLLGRLNGALVQPIGSLEAETSASVEIKKILGILKKSVVDGLLEHGELRLFQAITHYAPDTNPAPLLQVLADLIEERFHSMSSAHKTSLRKAVAHLDEFLNRDHRT